MRGLAQAARRAVHAHWPEAVKHAKIEEEGGDRRSMKCRHCSHSEWDLQRQSHAVAYPWQIQLDGLGCFPAAAVRSGPKHGPAG